MSALTPTPSTSSASAAQDSAKKVSSLSRLPPSTTTAAHPSRIPPNSHSPPVQSSPAQTATQQQQQQMRANSVDIKPSIFTPSTTLPTLLSSFLRLIKLHQERDSISANETPSFEFASDPQSEVLASRQRDKLAALKEQINHLTSTCNTALQEVVLSRLDWPEGIRGRFAQVLESLPRVEELEKELPRLEELVKRAKESLEDVPTGKTAEQTREMEEELSSLKSTLFELQVSFDITSKSSQQSTDLLMKALEEERRLRAEMEAKWDKERKESEDRFRAMGERMEERIAGLLKSSSSEKEGEATSTDPATPLPLTRTFDPTLAEDLYSKLDHLSSILRVTLPSSSPSSLTPQRYSASSLSQKRPAESMDVDTSPSSSSLPEPPAKVPRLSLSYTELVESHTTLRDIGDKFQALEGKLGPLCLEQEEVRKSLDGLVKSVGAIETRLKELSEQRPSGSGVAGGGLESSHREGEREKNVKDVEDLKSQTLSLSTTLKTLTSSLDSLQSQVSSLPHPAVFSSSSSTQSSSDQAKWETYDTRLVHVENKVRALQSIQKDLAEVFAFLQTSLPVVVDVVQSIIDGSANSRQAGGSRSGILNGIGAAGAVRINGRSGPPTPPDES
ncbi:hypothetical protein T439DRAFT_375688 [Meredithblackwellia eburnea MCA 4105]